MDKEFSVYIDRLKDGHTQKISETIDPSFLDVAEDDLSFHSPVVIAGEVYLAEDHLVLHLKGKTEALIPCAICNEKFPLPVEIDFYHTQPLEEFTNPIFNYLPALRESILLQVPPFAECRGGHCPERTAISQYLKKEETGDPHAQFPFSDL